MEMEFNYTEKMLFCGSVVNESEMLFDGTEDDYKSIKEKWEEIAANGYEEGYRCYEEEDEFGRHLFLTIQNDKFAFIRAIDA